jgi:hypothetical protein
MSIIINDIKHHFSIYIFSLFEALFLIFIIYFLLKKKDIYNKDYDIKYDWYFYLRISIIILVFFNFALYIYNITNFPPINPKKTGGVPREQGEQVQKKTSNYLSKCYKLFYLYNIKKVKIYEKYNNWVRNIKTLYALNDSKNIENLYETVLNYLLEYNNNLTILKLKEKAIIIGEKINIIGEKINIPNEYINQLYDRNIDYEKRILKQLENIMIKYESIKKVDTIQKEPMSDKSNNTLDTYLKELTDLNLTDLNLTDLNLTDLDLNEFTEEEKNYLLSKDDDGGEDALSKLQESIKKIDKISPNDELKNLEKKEAKKEAKEQAKKEAKEKAKKEAKQIYKNIKKLVTKNNSETDELIKKAKDLAEEKATEQINEISVKINEAKKKAKEAKEAKDKAKEAKDKGETKEERKIRINTERVAKNERYKDIILEKILIKSLKDKLLKILNK